MPQYKYTARDERGRAVNGTLAATSPEALADQLRRMGYFVTRCRELAAGAAGMAWWPQVNRVGLDDLVLLDVQLAKMVQVGIPLVTALETLAQQTSHPYLQRVVREIAKAVESGSSFSEALVLHPTVFSALFVSMVRAGEASGKLDEILRRLALFAKRHAELRQQLMTALTYPCLLAVMGLGTTVFLLLGIIPKFMKIFLEAGVALPLPTLLLHGVSRLLQHDGLVLLGGGGVVLAALAVWMRTPAGGRQRDALLLKLPVLGELVRRSALAQMSRTLETLLASGVPVLESLAIAEETCGNTLIAETCRAAQRRVKGGGAMSAAFQESGQCPPMVVQMVAIGESSGTVDQMLGEIAQHYDELVQHSLKRLVTLIEPAFLVIMGGMIALIMASVLLPLFRMVNVVHH